jgi:PAS domain S-box-containing protein
MKKHTSESRPPEQPRTGGLKELRLSLERYELAQRAAHVGIWDWDITTNTLSWSRTIEPMFGFSPGEFGRTYDEFLDCVHPDDRSLVADSVNACLKQGHEYDIEHRIVWPDGSVRWVSETGDVIRDENHRPVRMLGIVKDITARKAAKDKLQGVLHELEQRVEERTARLATENVELLRQVEEAKSTAQRIRLNEARLETLCHLSHMGEEASLADIASYTLDQGIRLTESEVGFLGFLDEHESVYTLHTVSKNVVKQCRVTGDPVQWHIAEAGIWADAIRHRQTLFVNDYTKARTTKKGLPEGHFPLQRFMIVPIFEGERIVGAVGVGNKRWAYNRDDERQLSLLADGMWRYVQRNLTKAALQESRERLRLLSKELVEAQETERKRVAHELHDSIGGKLTAIKYGVEKALAQPDSNQLPKGVSLKDVVSMVQDAIQETRRISARLRPLTLDDLGILRTISAACEEFRAIYSDIRIQEEFHVEENDIPEPLKIVIYRILQEALNNVAKYAMAKLVRISLRKKGDNIELTIDDDGRGFDIDKVRSKEDAARTMGLAGMEERTGLSGGSFEIRSTKGHGTMIRASWPAAL